MKPILLILILFVLVTGCRKAKCKKATITQSGMPCALWGIKVDSETYPADSIPLGFRREGEVVCVDYQLYQDMIGDNVTEIIIQTVTARKLETTYQEVLNSIHPHPTISESVKDAIEVAYGEAIHL